MKLETLKNLESLLVGLSDLDFKTSTEIKIDNCLKDVKEALDKQLSIHVTMCSLDLDEIEKLVILKHYDDSEFGWDKQTCQEMREESRKAVGYTKSDL